MTRKQIDGQINDRGQPSRRAKVHRVAGVLLFALLLAGCDSCGDFISPIGHAQVCRKDAPQPH